MVTEPLSTSTHLRDLKALLSPIKAYNNYCLIHVLWHWLCRTEETKAPEAVVPHNGTETVNNESKRDSAKLSITCSSIVTKVQNGGVTRHSRGLYKIILIRLMIILARVMMSTYSCFTTSIICHHNSRQRYTPVIWTKSIIWIMMV